MQVVEKLRWLQREYNVRGLHKLEWMRWRVILECACRQAADKRLKAISMKISWCRRMQWMEGMQSISEHLNIVKLIEELDQKDLEEAGEARCVWAADIVPDLCNYDMETNFASLEMQAIAEEHADFMDPTSSTYSTRC